SEGLFEASVAVAWKVVVELLGTEAVMPGEEKFAAVSVAAGEPVQLAFAYRFTVEPGSAFPCTFGELSLAGEAGLVPVRVGGSGGVVSWPTVITFEPLLDWPSGLVIVTSLGPFEAAVVSRSSVTCVGSVKLTPLTETPPLTEAEM